MSSGAPANGDFPRDRNLISPQALATLWALTEDRRRLSAAERALLALALGELAVRREDGRPASGASETG